MKRLLFLLCLLLLLSACSAALADPAVSFSPEQPRVGDYVDVTVTPARADPEEILYELLLDGEKSITYKPENKAEEHHLTASFRPRLEGVYTLPPKCPARQGGYGKSGNRRPRLRHRSPAGESGCGLQPEGRLVV